MRYIHFLCLLMRLHSPQNKYRPVQPIHLNVTFFIIFSTITPKRLDRPSWNSDLQVWVPSECWKIGHRWNFESCLNILNFISLGSQNVQGKIIICYFSLLIWIWILHFYYNANKELPNYDHSWPMRMRKPTMVIVDFFFHCYCPIVGLGIFFVWCWKKNKLIFYAQSFGLLDN